MKLIVVLTLLVSTIYTHKEKTLIKELPNIEACEAVDDVTEEYRKAFLNYLVKIYIPMITENNANVVFSAKTLWLQLAALAEGGDALTKQQLFKFLDLPEDACLRQAFYKKAIDIFVPGDDVKITSENILIIDESLRINSQWEKLVSKNSLLNIIKLPTKSDPIKSVMAMEHMLSVSLEGIDLTGNSMILNTADYNGLWTRAFADSNVERTPFYSQKGEQIGYVDLMKMKKRVKMNYVPKANATIIELPAGNKERHRFLFAIFETDNIIDIVKNIETDMVKYMFENLQWTEKPVEIAIPRINMTSIIDMRRILEGAGITSFWTNEEATRSISDPAALPSSFIHRATLSLNTGGVEPGITEDIFTPSESNNGFIANKPILFCVCDAETYTTLMVAAYSVPTYWN